MTDDKFQVFQFFEDGSYELVRPWCHTDEAMRVALHYCTSVGAKLGITKRVIVVDNGDCIAFEWKFGEGVVFPIKNQL